VRIEADSGIPATASKARDGAYRTTKRYNVYKTNKKRLNIISSQIHGKYSTANRQFDLILIIRALNKLS